MKKKILLVYPEIPSTYWSFDYALNFTGQKSLMPPLGLITVASLLPDHYDLTLVDMNIKELTRKDVQNSDLVFISAMIVQKDSFRRVVDLCRDCGKEVVAGGPYVTTGYETIEGVDYFVLNEAEITLPLFIRDYENGNTKHVYKSSEKPDMTTSPVPKFDLLDMGAYSTMAIQTSRGCPFNCEFCDIIVMFGRTPRYKTSSQVIRELDSLYSMGYRGPLFIVDDNFIGNIQKVKKLLREICSWQEDRDFPFSLFTEASINLAEDDELLHLMSSAGFNMVFVGIESPVKECLEETGKFQNLRAGSLESVIKIQKTGIEVLGGFIIGFDSDPDDIFDIQIDFIQRAGIPVAMIGLMIVMPETQLWHRLRKEGRLRFETSGNNTHDLDLNFDPVMDEQKLIEGYKKVISTVYEPKNYFERCLSLLKRIPKTGRVGGRVQKGDVKAFFLSLFRQTFSSYGLIYLQYLAEVLMHNRKNFPLAVGLAVKGYHFFKITEDVMTADALNKKREEFLSLFKKDLMTKKMSVDNVCGFDINGIISKKM